MSSYRRCISAASLISLYGLMTPVHAGPPDPVLTGPYLPGMIAAGGFHSLAVKSNLSIEAWGYNNFGQRIVPIPNTDFVAVSAGELFSLGLKSNGVVVGWGRNLEGQISVPAPNTNFVALAAGGFHSLALQYSGIITAWGRNTSGQTNVPAPNTGFVAIAAGRNHSLGLRSDSRLAAWGSDSYGQSTVPAPNTNFIAMAGGDWHTLGLKRNGTIVAWGRNQFGQLNVPFPNTNFVAVAAGFVHSIGLRADGTVAAWGDNTFGQINIPEPNANFVAISANGYHSLALRSDGRVMAWGRNTDGQTNVPLPNADFGIKAPGVLPSSGSVHGGYPVTVRGYFLGGDITNVTLAGIAAASIVSQSSTHVTVIASSAPAPMLGDVRAYSSGDGLLIHDEPFRYVGEQVITYTPLGPQIITNRVELSAVASSGLPVSFAVATGPGTISDGTNLTFTGDGSVSLLITQAGNEEWYAAPPITNTFLVDKAVAEISLTNLHQVYDGTPRLVQAITSPTNLFAEILYDGSPVAPVNAGTYTVSATIDDPIYSGSVSNQLVISPAPLVFTFGDTNVVYDGLPKPVTVEVSTNVLSLVVTYGLDTNAPVNAGNYEVVATVYDLNYASAATTTLVIAKADQSITFGEIADQIATNTLSLSATASSGLPVSFSVATGPVVISGGTNVSFTGAGFVGISANQGGNSNWNAAGSALSFFSVSKANQVLTFPFIGNQYVTNVVRLNAAASSGLPVTYQVISGPATISGVSNLSFYGTGEVAVVARQLGTPIWNAAPDITQAFEVDGDLVWLAVSAQPNGSVSVTSGWQMVGTVVAIEALPNPYYRFSHWLGDIAGSLVFTNPLSLLMDGPKTIVAVFAEQMTTNGVSIPWLVSFGITNDFEAAVRMDHDGDRVLTGDEYFADTIPTDGTSYLAWDRLQAGPGSSGIVLAAPVSMNRRYDLEYSTNAVDAVWIPVPEFLNITPASPYLVITNAPGGDLNRLYRLRVYP